MQEAMNTYKTLICLLSCNQKDLTLACLDSLMQLEDQGHRILLVDNGSKDDLVEVVNKKFPDVTTIKLQENTGPAGGRNFQIKYFLNSDYDYLFFIDNDAIVDKVTLKELIKVAQQDKKVGAVGARVLFYDQPDVVYNDGAIINWPKGNLIDADGGKHISILSNQTKNIDTFPYGFGIIKREALERIGLIPEQPYYMYYEETEWHLRFKKLGYNILLAPKAKIWHKASSTLGRDSAIFYYYRTRNRLLFVVRNAPKLYLPVFFFYFLYDFSYNILLTLYLSGKKREIKAAILGVVDFLRGVTGKKSL